jgi:serine protease DegQ
VGSHEWQYADHGTLPAAGSGMVTPRIMRLPVASLALLLGFAVSACATPDEQPGASPSPAAPVAQQETRGIDAGVSIPEIVEDVAPSVVAIFRDEGGGSGVIWSSDGLIVTNEHVVRGARELTVVFADGDRQPAELIAFDRRTDIAVLRVNRDNLPAATFAEGLPRVGDLALAIGNPIGFENSVTAGIISGLNRVLPGAAQQSPALVDLIQTDAAISPGNSGGALVNAAGEVMGINIAYIPPNAPGGPGAVSLGFAVPASTVTSVVDQLLENGQVAHAYLGVQLTTLSPSIAERYGLGDLRGAVILDLESGGPADEAGIEVGDLVIRAGDTDVGSVEDLLGELRRSAPGDDLELVVVSNGSEEPVTVTLGELPEG